MEIRGTTVLTTGATEASRGAKAGLSRRHSALGKMSQQQKMTENVE
jgi:hypothetical protein